MNTGFLLQTAKLLQGKHPEKNPGLAGPSITFTHNFFMN